jgi:hypothetical protein
MIACLLGFRNVVKKLLEEGADIDEQAELKVLDLKKKGISLFWKASDFTDNPSIISLVTQKTSGGKTRRNRRKKKTRRRVLRHVH